LILVLHQQSHFLKSIKFQIRREPKRIQRDEQKTKAW
jgi:hypothetical protein